MKKLLTLIFTLFSLVAFGQDIHAPWPNVTIGEDATFADYWELKATTDRLDIDATGIASPIIRLSDYIGPKLIFVDADGDLTLISDGTTGQVLTTNGSGTYSFGDLPASVSFGTTTQIPYTNTTGDDFLYSSVFTFNGSALTVNTVQSETGGTSDLRLIATGASRRINLDPGASLIIGSTTANSVALGSTTFPFQSLTVGSTLRNSATTNQLVLGTTNTTTISATAPAASLTYTIPDKGGNDTFAFLSDLTGSSVTMSRIGSSTYSTAQHFMNFAMSAGHVSGGAITDAGTATINVAAGTGVIRITDDDTGEVKFFDWAASAGVAIPSNTVRYIGVEYNAGTPQVVARTSQNWNYDTDFPLGRVINEGGTLFILNDPWQTGDATGNIIERFDSEAYIARDDRTGGLILSNTGTRNIAVTAGTLISRLSEFDVAAINTSTTGTFDAYYRDGVGGFTKQAAQTQWNNTQYDDGTGTLATATLTTYINRWWYVTTGGALIMMYGTEDHATLALAIDEAQPTTVPNRLSETGILIGRFIVQASGTTPTQTQSAFSSAFRFAGVTTHNNLSGLQGGTTGEYYHATSAEYTGTGTGNFVRATSPAITTPTISGGTINNASIGATTPSTGDFTSGSFGVTTGSGLTTSKLIVQDGALDGNTFVTIGNQSVAANQFLQLGIAGNNGNISVDNADGLILGSKTDANQTVITPWLSFASTGAATFSSTVSGAFNGTIGATTPSSGSFTTGRFSDLAGTGSDIVYADTDGDLVRSTVEITDIGDVDGPASSTDDAIARFDGTTGKIIQNSGVIIGDEVSNGVTVHRGSTDASDNKLLQLSGGGGSGNTRGATVQLNGNEHASAPGQAVLSAGNVANGYIQLVTYEGSVFIGASNPVRIVGKIPYTSAPAGTLNSNEWEQSLYDDGASPVVRFRYNDAGTTKTIDVGPLVSDTVYKESWEPMLTSDAKSFVMNTKPYKWYGKGDVLKGEHWGFIANYSPKSPAFPISEDGTYHWKPEHMIAPLYAVVQEQQKEIDDLKSKLSSLEERILAIEKTTKNK